MMALLYAAVGAAGLYALAVGALYVMQERIIFPRHELQDGERALPADAEEISIESEDGHRLVGYLRRADAATPPLLLAFSGNAWNARDFLAYLSERLPGLDIIAFHYRGYPPSQGEPSQAALFADALAIHERASELQRGSIVLATGVSLGSAVAAYLGGKRPIDGLILVTPFDSVRAVAAQQHSWAPVGQLLKHPFDAASSLQRLDVPVAVILASDDVIIPRERSLALVDTLSTPVLVETIPDSGHNSIYGKDEFDQTLRRAVRLLTGAEGAGAGEGA